MTPPFEINFDDTNKIIEVMFNDGQDNYMMRMQCIEHMEKAIEQSGYDRLLVNLSKIAEPMSIINQFTLGEKVSHSRIQKIRTAVLHSPQSDNPNDIISLVTGNRGRDIRDFVSRGNAVEWLQN